MEGLGAGKDVVLGGGIVSTNDPIGEELVGLCVPLAAVVVGACADVADVVGGMCCGDTLGPTDIRRCFDVVGSCATSLLPLVVPDIANKSTLLPGERAGVLDTGELKTGVSSSDEGYISAEP